MQLSHKNRSRPTVLYGKGSSMYDSKYDFIFSDQLPSSKRDQRSKNYNKYKKKGGKNGK